ncbi:MAG: hypothetical protein WBX15_17770 [Thermoanaerobaculia bacterium]
MMAARVSGDARRIRFSHSQDEAGDSLEIAKLEIDYQQFQLNEIEAARATK